MDPRIGFFWTGEKVISDHYSAAHLVRVAADMGRKPFLWDNHMANDSRIRAHQLYLAPAESSWEVAAGHDTRRGWPSIP